MPEILASCWTTAGDALPVPGRDASPLDMVARIEAAGRAGFSGFGMVLADLQHIEATAAWSDVAAALGASGLAWVELEILQDWWLPTGPQRQGCDRQCRLLFEAADRFSAFRLKVAGDTVDLRRPDLDAWAGQLHALCDAAANHGLGVALEFLRFSNIPDLSTAVDLVARADHPAAGVMIDSWHVDRTGTNLQDIACIPPGLLGGIELDDGLVREADDEYEDTVNNRRYLGQGQFRNGDLIRSALAAGWSGPWGVEIISTEHRARALDDSLPEVMATTLAALVEAGAA